MDLALGLAITSTTIRWVLVEGATGEGTPTDYGAIDVASIAASHSIAESAVHAIGVTWTSEAEEAASTVLRALADQGFENVIAVSDIEAAEALAGGIAEVAGYDEVAVCIVEADVVVVAVVDYDGVTVDRIDRSLENADADELASSVIAMADRDGRKPDAIFVLGSDAVDPIVSSLDAAATSPVISTAEADLAMARGAALASARAVNTLDARAVRPQWMSKVGALTSVLVAAVLTFVVSLSVAIGLRLTPQSEPEQPQIANAAGEPARVAAPPAIAQAAPQPPPPAAPPPAPAAPPVEETLALAAPPATQFERLYEPPAAEPVAPPPIYEPAAPPPAAPPPAPVYVPPPVHIQPAPPQPRLRDRILERIPIIGRFHEPDYPYPR